MPLWRKEGIDVDQPDTNTRSPLPWAAEMGHTPVSQVDSYSIIGFAITIIVRNNPKEFTVRFGRPRGKAIGENYISITLESIDAEGSTNPGKIFKELTGTTTSYTYRSPTS